MIRQNKELHAFFEQYPADVTVVSLSKQEILVEQGVFLRHAYVIKTGLFKCVHTDEQGNEFVQEFFGEGELIGELEMLLDEKHKYTIASITALTESSVYAIPAFVFEKLLHDNKIFNRLLLTAFAEKIRYKALRHAFNQTHSLRENIQYLQQDNPAYLESISKQDLANYLGITIRSLNRELRKQRQ